MLNGPTVEFSSVARREWYVNDKSHRLDGPAVEWHDGTKRWFVNGKCHRLDGPAEEWSNGSKYWYIDNVRYTEEEWKLKI